MQTKSYLRGNKILFCGNEILFRGNELLFWENNEIIIRGNEIIICGNEIILKILIGTRIPLGAPKKSAFQHSFISILSCVDNVALRLKLLHLSPVPGAPGPLTFIVLSLTSLNVTWLPPAQPNGVILHYEVSYYQANYADGESRLGLLLLLSCLHYMAR